MSTMVNSGGPSKGCLTCIQRKIRCDRERPVCGQCSKSSRECGGYRESIDIMFRDQSQTIGLKVNAESQVNVRKKPPGQESRDTPNASIARHASPSASYAPVLTISPTPDEEAGLINFFANNFTCTGPPEFPTNLFWMPNNLEDLLKNECAKQSLASVGAMARAQLQHSCYHYREAQKKYSLALRGLAEQWRSEAEIDKDYALFTVFFLSFFEILGTYDSNVARQSWLTHLCGVGTLLQRRGEEFLGTGLGARMLLQTRSQAISHALQTRSPVAEAFREPARRNQRSILSQFKYADDLDILMIRLATLQAQLQSLSGPDGLKAELAALEGDFREWERNVPPPFAAPIFSTRRQSRLWWDMRHDTYATPIAVQAWARARTSRIVIYNLIEEISLRDTAASVEAPGIHQTRPGISVTELQDLVVDICAIMPICYRPADAEASPSTAQSQPPLGTLYWLLWPIEVVGLLRGAPVELTKWTQSCLEQIHEMTGTVRAQVSSDRLKRRLVNLGADKSHRIGGGA